MATTHPPIIHIGGHLVPPPRRSAQGQAGLLSLLFSIMGALPDGSLLIFSLSARPRGREEDKKAQWGGFEGI
jgi:hypothetical protein